MLNNMKLKTIKIIFNDGTYSIQKYIVEYVSGKKFLFAAQQGADGTTGQVVRRSSLKIENGTDGTSVIKCTMVSEWNGDVDTQDNINNDATSVGIFNGLSVNLTQG